MLPSAGPEDGQRFMAFMLEDKIGVIKLPLTGNPHLASALIVHPQGVRLVFFTTYYIQISKFYHQLGKLSFFAVVLVGQHKGHRYSADRMHI